MLRNIIFHDSELQDIWPNALYDDTFFREAVFDGLPIPFELRRIVVLFHDGSSRVWYYGDGHHLSCDVYSKEQFEVIYDGIVKRVGG